MWLPSPTPCSTEWEPDKFLIITLGPVVRRHINLWVIVEENHTPKQQPVSGYHNNQTLYSDSVLSSFKYFTHIFSFSQNRMRVVMKMVCKHIFKKHELKFSLGMRLYLCCSSWISLAAHSQLEKTLWKAMKALRMWQQMLNIK